MNIKLKSIPFICISLASLFVLKIDSVDARKAVGTHECSRYQDNDPRPVTPKANLLEASLESKGNGYVLKVMFDDERGRAEIPLDSKLNFVEKSGRLIPYSSEPLKISSNGKFKLSILGRSEWCTYSGVAKISPSAKARLFGKKEISSPTSSTQVSNNKTIASGLYTYQTPTEFLIEVKGNKYREIEMGKADPWKKITELKFIKHGVISIRESYFCLLPENSVELRAKCTSKGWVREK